MQAKLVAQEVEAAFVGGGVSDVACVTGAALIGGHDRVYEPDGQAESLVHRPHPTGVTPRQIVVNGHYVDAFAFPRQPGDGGYRSQRFALARLHFRDPAIGQRECARQLHVMHFQVENPLGGDGGSGDRCNQTVRGLEIWLGG